MEKCIYLGDKTGIRIKGCETCKSSRFSDIEVFRCSVYKECTVNKKAKSLQCCKDCPSKILFKKDK